MATQDEIVAAANANYNEWSPRAANFLNTLESLLDPSFGGISNISAPNWISPDFGNFLSDLRNEPAPSGRTVLSKPSFDGTRPTNAQMNIAALPSVSVPELDASAPSISLPARPTLGNISFPSKPSLDSVAVPSAPTISIPTRPDLTIVEFPDAPSLQIPTFTETFPEAPDLLTPTNNFSYSEELVDTPLLDLMTTLITDDLTEPGGYGILPTDEQALVDRFIDRIATEALVTEENTFEQFASRGYLFPPGATAKATEASAQQRRLAIAEANREVFVNRADLLRKAREFAIGQGIAVDAELLRYHGFRLERALNASRFAAEFGITVLDAEIRRYNSQVEAFTSFAQAYEAQVRAVLARTDIFKTEVDAAKAKQEASLVAIQVYEAQVRAEELVVSLYNAQLNGARTALEIEAQKIENFRTEVQAYASQVDAQRTKMQEFEIAVRSELGKLDVFRTQIDANTAEVRAAALRNEINVRKREFDVQEARLRLERYAADIDRYRTDLQAEVAKTTAAVDVFRGEVSAYSALMNGWEGYYRFVGEDAQAKSRHSIEQGRLQALEEELETKVENFKERIRFDAARAGSDITSAVLSGAQGIMSALITKDE